MVFVYSIFFCAATTMKFHDVEPRNKDNWGKPPQCYRNRGSMSQNNSTMCNNSKATLWQKNDFWAQHKLPGLLLMTSQTRIYLPALKFRNCGFLDILQTCNGCPWPKAHQNRGHQSHLANIACNSDWKAPKIVIVPLSEKMQQNFEKTTRTTQGSTENLGQLHRTQKWNPDLAGLRKLDLFGSNRQQTEWCQDKEIFPLHIASVVAKTQSKHVKYTTGTSSIAHAIDATCDVAKN